MVSVVRRVIKKLKSYKADKLTKDFISHNLRIFNVGAQAKRNVGGPEILFEFNWLHPSHIAYSYLANVLAGKYGASINAYVPTGAPPFWRRIEWKLSKCFSLRDFAIYRSFGVTGFFYPQVSSEQLVRARRLTNQILGTLKTKSDIESIAVDGIWLGDLIYDSYLRTFNKPTIEITDESFKAFLLKALGLYIYWDDYFKTHDVRAVNASHCVYVIAIPLRIALSKDIPAFVVGAVHAYRLSKKNIFDSCDFLEFRQTFKALPVDVQTEGLARAKQRIELRFAGKVGVDMGYATKSAYGMHKAERLLKESARLKILIATHCFFDSPHSFGNNLFPDFYEWLDFLGKMSLETDYDWYIKTHPDYLPGTMEIIDSFIQKYPKFNLLPSDSSHHQIIAEGINVALTCYGTIGLEYAALGIPVVNASLHNPHIAYNFNIHPQSVDEYREILKQVGSLDLKIDKNEVYEYYYMRHLYHTNDWLFDNFNRTSIEVTSVTKQFAPNSPLVYEAWMRECTPEKHAKIMAKLDAFVDRGDYRVS